MCGVVGFTGWPVSADARIAAIRRGIQAIVHRGPEEVGYYQDPYFTLGTVRLSVVDLAMGKQPMITADGRYLAGFNGEVFNYLELRRELQAAGVPFVTRSDTEVLLNSLAYWGVDEALRRIHGQLGFAFYDRRERRLVLGRDPIGERPMYYAVTPGGVFFASEVKGIFSFPQFSRVLDGDRVLATARFWAPIPDETCFAGIQCLPQGHYLTVCDGKASITKYYHDLDTPPGQQEGTGLSFEDGMAGLREVLRDSVTLRLRGDYPRGVFVSGGVDSAIIAATVDELLDTQVRAFSIGVDSPGIDETASQEKVVAALGLDASSVVIRASDIRARFPKLVEQCEMPLRRTAPVACGMLAEHIGAAGYRIVLGGEGADEIFLGYDIIKEACVVQQCLSAGSFQGAGDRLGGALSDLWYSSTASGEDIMAFHAARAGRPGLLPGPHLRRFEAERACTYIASAHGQAGADERLSAWILSQAPDFARWDLVDQTQWLDIHTLFTGYGMTCHGDRPGTGCGVETRFPFLDRRVIAYAARLPRHWKLAGLDRGKHILREAYRDLLPADVIDRPKFGMRTPGATAMLPGGADDWVSDVLSPASVRASSVLREDAVTDLVARLGRAGGGISSTDSHAYLHVLSILLLEEIFVRNFRVPDTDIDRIMFKRVNGEDLPMA
jgi:asparagine synthase (glutamine-hydrolysing)